MRRLDRLCLVALLLALQAGIAHAQTCPTSDFGNGAPCRTRTTESDCTFECQNNGPLSTTCACYWDDPTNPSGFPMDTSNGANSGCSEATPCCWDKPCDSFGAADQCAPGGGGSDFGEDNCHWNPESGQCGCRPPLVVAPALLCQPTGVQPCSIFTATPSDIQVCSLTPGSTQQFSAPFDCVCPYVTLEEWVDQGARGAARRRRSTT